MSKILKCSDCGCDIPFKDGEYVCDNCGNIEYEDFMNDKIEEVTITK